CHGGGGGLAEKRQTGSFYTPTPVIDRVLAPVVATLVGHRRLRGTVCDPAVGCGFFPLRLISLLAESGRFTPAVIARWALKNIYGIDIDAGAVFLARTFLWLTLSTPDREYPPAPGRLVTGDALLGPAFGQEAPVPAAVGAVDWSATFPSVAAAGGFDAVIGNPPYEVLTNFGRHPERRVLAESLRHGGVDRAALGRPINLNRCFIQRSLQVLVPGGILAFVVPMSLARDRAAAPIRERLLRHEGAG
ncbi:MAG: SAM-dependent methyltransferase, partial [Planctomycetes bacterium]|nr:SAM-dependent methyltransferase [Planctomycetota bacterium]